MGKSTAARIAGAAAASAALARVIRGLFDRACAAGHEGAGSLSSCDAIVWHLVLIGAGLFYSVAIGRHFSPLIMEKTEMSSLAKRASEKKSNGLAPSSSSPPPPPPTKKLQKRPSSPDHQKPWWLDWKPRALTEEQELAVQEMMKSHFGPDAPTNTRRALVKTVVNDDWRAAAVRALTARQFNVTAARKLVDDMIEWRNENKMDLILHSPLESSTLVTIRSTLNDGWSGICNEGFPIYFFQGGLMDLCRTKKDVGLETIVTYHKQVMEYNFQRYFAQQSKIVGRTVSQITVVLNLKGFGAHNVKSDFWSVVNALSAIDNPYYYEWLHKVIIVHAGRFFRFFYRTASGILAPETKRKFNVLSSLAELEKHIPLHQLPTQFGGLVEDDGCITSFSAPWSHYHDAMDKYMLELKQLKTSEESQLDDSEHGN